MKPIIIVTDINRYHPARIGGGESYIRRLIQTCKAFGIDISVYVVGTLDDGVEKPAAHEHHFFFNNIDELVFRTRKQDAAVILFNLPLRAKLRLRSLESLYLLSLFYPASFKVALFRLAETFLLEYKGIFVPSLRMKSFYSSFFHSVAVLPPILPGEFDITNDDSRANVGFIGRLDPRKGGRKLIDFMTRNAGLDFNISYIKHERDSGVLELEEELLRLCKQSTLVPQNRYNKEVDQQLVDNLNKSAIFLQFYETLDSTVDLPLLLLEALACGCEVYTNFYFRELDEPGLLISMNYESSDSTVSLEDINETSLEMRLKSSSVIRSRFKSTDIINVLVGKLNA